MSGDCNAQLVRECLALEPAQRGSKYWQLHDRLKDDVYNICYRMTGNVQDALDATQTTFARLFRSIDSFRFEARFSSWAARIATNICIELHRRRRCRPRVSLEHLEEEVGELGRESLGREERESPHAVAERNELSDHVQAAIDRLSPKLREIIVLRYIEGQSYAELTSTLGLPDGTVRSRIYRAHAALGRDLAWLMRRGNALVGERGRHA